MEKFRYRIAAIAVAVLVAAGALAASAAVPPTARASGMTEYCDAIVGGYCPNAWNGGPFVKAYTPGVQNDWFQVNSLGGGLYDIEDMNTGTYIGDYNNNQYDARAGLVNYGGWGYRFQELGCEGITGAFIFQNLHWTNGRLSAPDSDGAQFYLNDINTNQCFLGRNF